MSSGSFASYVSAGAMGSDYGLPDDEPRLTGEQQFLSAYRRWYRAYRRLHPTFVGTPAVRDAFRFAYFSAIGLEGELT